MEIGIFGGSFNPPHIAHTIVAECIRDQFGLDQILWIPVYIPPHKSHHDLADAEHRLAMARLATSGNPAFAVSSVEIERKGASYTVDTLRSLTAAHPNDIFHLVIGEDSLQDFMTWRNPETIVSMAELLVYRRPMKRENQPTAIPEAVVQFPNRVRFAGAPLLEVSSVDIRTRVRAGRSIRYLVPDAVYEYIRKHGLYLPQS